MPEAVCFPATTYNVKPRRAFTKIDVFTRNRYSDRVNISSLQSIMLSIAESRSVEPVLDGIVRGVTESSEIALTRLWLISSDADCPVCRTNPQRVNSPALHLRASAGKSRKTGREYTDVSGTSHRIKMGERKIGQVAESGEPMLIATVTGKELWVADPEWIRAEGIQSFAAQPLIFRGETLGVLAVFSRASFSENEFKWLRTFADHAAVAIANARAFEELGRLKSQLEAENEYLHEEIRGTLHFGEIVGESAALRKVLEQVALVSETTATVLIQGESGTGKELIARAIHERSPRKDRPFIKVNCGAIPSELFESEFFGHVKGAFTGAFKDRAGRFELAHGGDLFLDEIAEIPLSLQSKLLRVLQEKQFERVGDTRTRTVEVRLITATNRDLKREVAAGRFREDLFYRLTVFPIELPPLRDRKEDIPALASQFLNRAATKFGLARRLALTRENLRQLQDYDWPGNIRELENVIERAVILARNSHKLRFDLQLASTRCDPPASAAARHNIAEAEAEVLTRVQLREREIQNILAALHKANGKIAGTGGAAEILGMRPTTLASRVRSLGLKKSFVAAPPT